MGVRTLLSNFRWMHYLLLLLLLLFNSHLAHLGDANLQINLLSPLKRRARITIQQHITQRQTLTSSPFAHTLLGDMIEVLEPESDIQIVHIGTNDGE